MNMSEASVRLVSVVIPCFNVRPYIAVTLDSLLAQSHADWEAIVVDDGSKDGTAEVVETYADGRIQLLRQENRGVSAARNFGVAVAQGTALLFLDGDDWLAPDALARMVSCLAAHPLAVAAYGSFCFTIEDGSHVTRSKSGPFPAGMIIERLMVENLFANGGHLLICAPVVAALEGFRSDLRFGEDWEFWCRVALSGPVVVVPGRAPLLFVRQRSSGAYLTMAADSQAFTACTDAIFGNPELRRRFRPKRLARLRARTESETDWIVGRELIRHGNPSPGLKRLRRSLLKRPKVRRFVLLAVAHLLPVLPRSLAGPFRPYKG